jgi:hypothetical protein
MMTFFKILKSCTVGAVSLVLTLSFAFTPLSPFFHPKPVQAQLVVQDPINLVQNTLSAGFEGVSAAGTAYLQLKEGILDTLAWTLINLVIEEMIRSTTAWVASGFEGRPAFLEDLNGFLVNIADTVVGEYIWEEGGPLSFLCSPFSLDVRGALQFQFDRLDNYADYGRTACTLSGIGDNVENLGAYMTQDWDNWFDVTMVPANNPYGALLEAQAELNVALATAKGSEVLELDFGSGFLSQKKCVDDPQDPEAVGPPTQTCTTITPGETIQSQISSTLNIPRERLAFADEINELIGALLTQLARGVLSEIGGGLKGLGSSGAGGESIFNDPRFPSDATGTGTVGIGNSVQDQLTADRAREERYRSLNRDVVNLATAALARTGPSCSATLRQNLTTIRTTGDANVARATQRISTINEYATRLSAPGISPAEIQQQLQTYLRSVRPTLTTDRQLAEVETSLMTLPSGEDQLLQALAAQGNVRAIAQLYERSCSPR